MNRVELLDSRMTKLYDIASYHDQKARHARQLAYEVCDEMVEVLSKFKKGETVWAKDAYDNWARVRIESRGLGNRLDGERYNICYWCVPITKQGRPARRRTILLHEGKLSRTPLIPINKTERQA